MTDDDAEALLRQWGRWDMDYSEIRALTGAYKSIAGKIIKQEVGVADVFDDRRGVESIDREMMERVDQVYRTLPRRYRRLVYAVYREGVHVRSIARERGVTAVSIEEDLTRVRRLFAEKLDQLVRF